METPKNLLVSEAGFLYCYVAGNLLNCVENEREINRLNSSLTKKLEDCGYDAEEFLLLSVYSEGIDEKSMNYGYHPISNNQNSEGKDVPISVKEEFEIFNSCVNKKVEIVKTIKKKKRRGMKKFGMKCLQMVDIIAKFPEGEDLSKIIREYNKTCK